MVVSVIGWTIIHSLWQCLGLLGALKLFLGFIDVRRSGVRYAAALWVLGLAVGCVLSTFLFEWRVFAGLRTTATGGVERPGSAAIDVVEIQGMAPGASFVYWLAKCCPYLTGLWVLGVVFYIGKLVLGGVELRRLRRTPGVRDVAAEAMLEGLRVRMRVVRTVRLLITDRVSEPMTFGFLRAVVVLPLQYLSFVPADQLEMILAHEVAHIRRRDYVVNLVQHVFDALLFFNPFFRMISTMVREEREYCCDDQAAVVAGDQRMMAVALTNLGLMKKGLALGLSATPARRSFYRRVTRLIEPGGRPALSVRSTLMGFWGAVVVVTLLTQCSRSTVAQDNLPAVGDRMYQVLTDNQAGYKEQVFNYSKAGKDHEIFLVQTQDQKHVMYAYMDGVRLNREELDAVTHVLKVQRATIVVTVKYKVGPPGRDTAVGAKMQKDTAALVKIMGQAAIGEVRTAMFQYRIDSLAIPAGVKQHELLTRIVVNNAYTAEDRQEMQELIRMRRAISR